MSPIELDQELASKLEGGMADGGAVELPFPVVYLWALNGQANYKGQVKIAPALYYGGWACKVEDMTAIMDQASIPLPTSLKQVTIATRDGGEFEAFTTRFVYVAPISKRESWLYDGKRFAEYIEGGRRHIQALCYLGVKEASLQQAEGQDKPFEPWGPVVLTAKGYQARNLLDAFGAWEKYIAPVRYRIGRNVPAWCFYLTLGTFGAERKVLNVGKVGAQSPITPIGVYMPDKLEDAWLESRFVGADTASAMAEYLVQAGPWLKAWQMESGNADQFEMASESARTGRGGNGTPPQPEEPPDDDVPF